MKHVIQMIALTYEDGAPFDESFRDDKRDIG